MMNKEGWIYIIYICLSYGVTFYAMPSNTPFIELHADWLTAVGTLLLAIVAVFQDKIRHWVLSPKLNISCSNDPPDCHKTIYKMIDHTTGQVILAAECYYFRIRVHNTGDRSAENVQVFAEELSVKQIDGTFKALNSFIPMRFNWANLGKPVMDYILPQTYRHCDIGHILDPVLRRQFPMEDDPRLGVSATNTILSCDLEVKPFTMTHLIPPGDYRLCLSIGATNAIYPIKEFLSIYISGQWFTNETQMLSVGTTLKVLDG